MAIQERWLNKDGLVVRFGPKSDKDENSAPAQAVTAGTLQEIVLTIPDATLLPDTATLANGGIDERGAKLPNGAVIVSAILYVDTGFDSGGAATLDVGTFRVDGSTGAGGAVANGLLAGVALGDIDTPGDVVTGGGAQIGKTMDVTKPAGRDDDTLFVAASRNVAAYTAGAGRVVITYRVPTTN